jgi:hypothetical protein
MVGRFTPPPSKNVFYAPDAEATCKYCLSVIKEKLGENIQKNRQDFSTCRFLHPLPLSQNTIKEFL